MRTPLGRLRLVAAFGALVVVMSTVGYRLFGQGWIDSLYQTMMTVTTVGFHENHEFSQSERVFTMGVMVTGVGTMAYLFTLGVQVIVEGQLGEVVGRRRMDRQIEKMSGHVVLCGWGRVGQAIGADLAREGKDFVIIDTDAYRLSGVDAPTVIGDASTTNVLRSAGIERADTLVAALAGDADNLLVTLTARELDAELFIVARARAGESIDKLTHAGADRVVNPQSLGAARMSSFIVQPNVAEFVDIVMHDPDLDLQIREVEVPNESPFTGQALGDCSAIDKTGVVVLAIRDVDGSFYTNPDPDMVIQPRQVIIGLGTDRQLIRLSGTLTTGRESV